MSDSIELHVIRYELGYYSYEKIHPLMAKRHQIDLVEPLENGCIVYANGYKVTGDGQYHCGSIYTVTNSYDEVKAFLLKEPDK